MQKNLLKFLVLFFLLAVAVADSKAEQPEGFDRPTKEQMERTRERIETLKIWKLTKALDLDEETAAQLFPLLNKYDKKRSETEQNLRESMIDIKLALKDKREDRLGEVLERFEKNHKSLQRIRDEERTELKKVLTIEQQARLVIFHHEFQKEIRKIIEQVRDRRHERFGRDRPSERPFPERT